MDQKIDVQELDLLLRKVDDALGQVADQSTGSAGDTQTLLEQAQTLVQYRAKLVARRARLVGLVCLRPDALGKTLGELRMAGKRGGQSLSRYLSEMGEAYRQEIGTGSPTPSSSEKSGRDPLSAVRDRIKGMSAPELAALEASLKSSLDSNRG